MDRFRLRKRIIMGITLPIAVLVPAFALWACFALSGVRQEVRAILFISCAGAVISSVLVGYLFSLERIRQREIEKVAYFEPLTGLPNLVQLQQFYDELPMKGAGYAYAFIGVEQLRVINQLFAYKSGDQVLQDVAKILISCVGEGELAVKLPQNNFALLLHAKDRAVLENRIAQLFEQLQEVTVQHCGTVYRYPCFCQGGVYFISGGESSLERIMHLTSLAFLKGKTLSQAPFVFFDSSMEEEMSRQSQLLEAIDGALERGEVIPCLQPKYELSNNKIIGAETLGRWTLPGGQVVSSKDFVPLLEVKGLILEYDMFILEEACKMISKWTKSELMPVPLGVNISRLNAYRENFVEMVVSLVEKYDVPACLIELELVESAIQEKVLASTMERLHDCGFIITVADYGSGAASLDLLRNMFINSVKMKSGFFIRKGEPTSRDRALAKNVIRMLGEAKIDVIAEKVETQKQADYLREIHCGFAQGFQLSPPLPCKEFEALIF